MTTLAQGENEFPPVFMEEMQRYGGVGMEIQQLKYFVEVVRQQSFTKAAAQLFVTQLMLTRSIKHLEEELNVRLLERTSKSFCLTDAGRILYERVQDFLLRYDDIFRTMTDVRSARVGEVRMSIPGDRKSVV